MFPVIVINTYRSFACALWWIMPYCLCRYRSSDMQNELGETTVQTRATFVKVKAKQNLYLGTHKRVQGQDKSTVSVDSSTHRITKKSKTTDASIDSTHNYLRDSLTFTWHIFDEGVFPSEMWNQWMGIALFSLWVWFYPNQVLSCFN